MKKFYQKTLLTKKFKRGALTPFLVLSVFLLGTFPGAGYAQQLVVTPASNGQNICGNLAADGNEQYVLTK